MLVHRLERLAPAGVSVEAEINEMGIETWADLAKRKRTEAMWAGGTGTERGKRPK